MDDSILKKSGANFFGFERIDSLGKHHYQLAAIRGTGDLPLTKNGVCFNQWITQKEYTIPLDKITKIEIRTWHNLKMKWPGKVLRIHYKEGQDIKIFGIKPGVILSLKGWQVDAYLWKEKIETLMKE
ncbi:MAG: hypothetical protein Q8P34_10955 [Bacteroidota bacterium]|nr:hypothetical protein [Bacteroidota bacterium]